METTKRDHPSSRLEEKTMVHSVDAFDPRPEMLFRRDRGTWQLVRELLGCAAILTLFIVFWLWGAATLTQPWGPDPETRSALRALEPSAVAAGDDGPARR